MTVVVYLVCELLRPPGFTLHAKFVSYALRDPNVLECLLRTHEKLTA